MNREKEIIVIPASTTNAMEGELLRQLRVASYSRVSTDFEEQLKSFHAQKEYYTNLILQNPKWKLAGTFADEGISGANTENRPGFQKMMRQCKRGKIDLIITKSISRFGRNTVKTVETTRELKAMGIGVIFEKENINTLEESSEFILTLLSSLAQEELYSLSKNIRKGFEMRMLRGEFTINYTQFYAYEKGENNKPKIIPHEAEIVRRIYRYYLMGKSQLEIATMLNDEGIPTVKVGKGWTNATVSSILKNEMYCGDKLLGKSYIEDPITKKVKKNHGERPMVHIKNNHDGIVSRDIYNQTQSELARRSSKQKVSDKTVTVQGKYSAKYALSEILICGECMTAYRRAIWPATRFRPRQAVWRCISRLEHGRKYCKHSPSIDEESLHQTIVNAIRSTTAQRDKIIPILGQHIEKALWEASGGEVNIEGLEQQIELLKNETMAIITASITGDTMADNEDRLRAINEEITQLHSQVLQFKEQSTTKADIAKTLHDYTEFLEMDTTDCEEYSDTLVRQLIHTIKVYDTHLDIYFKSGAVWTQPMELKVRNNHKGK